jgi:hypothetical protein
MAKQKRRPSVRQRIDSLERQRDVLLRRLAILEAAARDHRAIEKARALLGPHFCKASIAQRPAVLQSASWFLDVLEGLAPFL